jgi:hypothetical protein
MFERAKDWEDFLSCVERRQDADLMAAHFGLRVKDIYQYRQMYDGVNTLTEFGEMPDNLRQYAVGFKYRHLIRWIDTDDIKRARTDYDMGLVEIVTGPGVVKNEPAWILYAIPRKSPVRRELYFSAAQYA